MLAEGPICAGDCPGVKPHNYTHCPICNKRGRQRDHGHYWPCHAWSKTGLWHAHATDIKPLRRHRHAEAV